MPKQIPTIIKDLNRQDKERAALARLNPPTTGDNILISYDDGGGFYCYTSAIVGRVTPKAIQLQNSTRSIWLPKSALSIYATKGRDRYAYSADVRPRFKLDAFQESFLT